MKTFVGFYKFLCRLVVDDNAVDFTGGQSVYSISAFVVTFDGAKAGAFNIVGSIDVTGGAGLYADFPVAAFGSEVINAGDFAVISNNNDLNALGIGIGEVYVC